MPECRISEIGANWNQDQIAAATALLDGALLRRRLGPYQIQAAIAALHAHAPCALYSGLLRHLPTPVVELNAAVALAMSTSIDDGLKWIDRIICCTLQKAIYSGAAAERTMPEFIIKRRGI